MNPSFYNQAPAPCGYGTEWLVRLDNPPAALTQSINYGLGETCHLAIKSEEEARYWLKRFAKVNANRFDDGIFPAYTLLVVSVNLRDCLVTFKRSTCEQGHNAYIDPTTGRVEYYNPAPYEAVSF